MALHLVGPALAGNALGVAPEIYGVHTGLFPAKAGPTDRPRAFCGTGFSRESVRAGGITSRVCYQSSPTARLRTSNTGTSRCSGRRSIPEPAPDPPGGSD